MSPRTAVRRWVHVLFDEPEFKDGVEAFRFLADADAARGCGCLVVAHALSIRDRAVVVTRLSVARAAAERGDLVAACQVDFLQQQLEPCPQSDPSAQEMAARAQADLRRAREVTS